VGDEDEPVLGTSVTAFSLLETKNSGKSPPDDSDFTTRVRSSSTASGSFRVDQMSSLDEEMTFDFDG
jgi:hypothetical protein